MQRNDSRASRACQEKNPGSFAERHKHKRNGWVARPRWIDDTDFWKGLRGVHRSIIDQLFRDIARQPRTWNGAALKLERGQAACSVASLARRSGVTPKQARFAIDRAEAEGVISRRILFIVVDGHAQRISLISWLDFDTYDSTAPAAEGRGKSKPCPEGKSKGESAAVVSPDSTTGYGDPPLDQGKSKGESVLGPEGQSSNTREGQHPLQEKSLQTATTKEKARVNASRSAPPTPAEVQAVFDAWNQLGPPFPKALALSDKRQRTIKARLGDEWWAAHWREAIERVKKSPFCRGKNDRQWKANLDFFTRPDTATKALEGAYDGDRTPQGYKPSSSVGLPLYKGGVEQPGSAT